MRWSEVKSIVFQAVKGSGINPEAGQVSDSEDEPEGEELLKDVKDRKQSKPASASLVSAQEKALLERLHSQAIQHNLNNHSMSLQQDIPSDKLLTVPTYTPKLPPTPHPSKLMADAPDESGSKFKFDTMSLSSLKRYASRSSLLSTVSNVRNKLPVSFICIDAFFMTVKRFFAD